MEQFEQGEAGMPTGHQASRLAPRTLAWVEQASFYHLYPLGALGCPRRNPACEGPAGAEHPAYPAFEPGQAGLDRLAGWIDHWAGMGFNALYLGPVFESSAHGYDTVDYYRVDRRLGDNASLRRFVDACHARGIKVVLDAVLNHVGRRHRAFRDLQRQGPASAYASWFAGLDFSRRGPAGDAFAYEGWHGHYDLVKLDTQVPAVQQELLGAVSAWVREFDIDGLRLDAADCLAFPFLEQLSAHCRSLKPDFWLMGEVVHGDYRHWAQAGRLDSVTNYEAYKGLWSSLNDNNYWEIDWTLKRQFGPSGVDTGRYRELCLYNFADNHDVDRVASTLSDPGKLDLLHALLFAMPGVPSVYYGSEWGITGKRQPGSDDALRPAIGIAERVEREAAGKSEAPELCGRIAGYIALRREHAALRSGRYKAVQVSNEQLAFWRDLEGRTVPGGDQAPVLAVFNQAAAPCRLELPSTLALAEGRSLVDLLDPGYRTVVKGGRIAVELPARRARWLRLE